MSGSGSQRCSSISQCSFADESLRSYCQDRGIASQCSHRALSDKSLIFEVRDWRIARRKGKAASWTYRESWNHGNTIWREKKWTMSVMKNGGWIWSANINKSIARTTNIVRICCLASRCQSRTGITRCYGTAAWCVRRSMAPSCAAVKALSSCAWVLWAGDVVTVEDVSTYRCWEETEYEEAGCWKYTVWPIT